MNPFAEFFNFFAVTYQDNYCSHMLIPLLCYHYFPLCSPECPRLSVTPSRQLCTEAVEACLPYARVLYGETFNSTFPEDLDCSNFPDANYLAYDMECIENTSNALQPCQCASTVYIDSPNPGRFLLAKLGNRHTNQSRRVHSTETLYVCSYFHPL